MSLIQDCPTSLVASPMMTPRQGEQEKNGTFETIAAEASARLSGLFGPSVPAATVTGDAPPGATAPIKPALPIHGGAVPDGGKTTPTHMFHSPAPSIREPHRPASSGAITSEQVIELVKSLTQKGKVMRNQGPGGRSYQVERYAYSRNLSSMETSCER